jgi:hypothetical protein
MPIVPPFIQCKSCPDILKECIREWVCPEPEEGCIIVHPGRITVGRCHILHNRDIMTMVWGITSRIRGRIPRVEAGITMGIRNGVVMVEVGEVVEGIMWRGDNRRIIVPMTV